MTYIPTDDGDEDPVYAPRTHVFIIGVGDYPAMADTNNPYKMSFGLKPKLSTTLNSAREVANWFIEEYPKTRTNLPLGSVELVLSPDPSSNPSSPSWTYKHPTDPTISVQGKDATIGSIMAAFLKWYARCDTDKDNIAIFYFGGHGLQDSTQLLLAEDFCVNQVRPLAGAIDFNLSKIWMARCLANTQCFFIDACRTNNPGLQGQIISDAVTLKVPISTNIPRSINTLVLNATRVNQLAHGAGYLTRFAKALLDHLAGRGATEEPGGDWVVTHSDFGGYVRDSMKRDNDMLYPFDPSKHQNPHPVIDDPLGASQLHHLLGPPEIPVRVWCRPAAATSDADLELRPTTTRGTPTQNRPATGNPEPWQTLARAARYEVEARFPQGNYRDNTKGVSVAPPFCDEELDV